jgi:hypothetical protein
MSPIGQKETVNVADVAQCRMGSVCVTPHGHKPQRRHNTLDVIAGALCK